MRIPLEWLKELIEITMTAEELAHALTMAGLEVEAMERLDGDTVFEVNVTPNRPDCLSVLGIAREVSALTGRPVRFPEHEIAGAAPTAFKVEITDAGLCRRYAGRVVRGVAVGESPVWMRERLEKCGIRAINNVVDVTNYVLLELGHPLHAFDLDLLEGGTIRVGRAGEGKSITTLDGVKRELPPESLVIWDAAKPVALAGVMGGADTEVTDSTRNVFLESAWFLPASVRRTSRRLGLRSESSYRFERGTDIEMLATALDRAAHLIGKLAGGTHEARVDAYPVRFEPRPVKVRFEKINRVLGTALGRDEALEALGKLGLQVRAGGEELEVTPPPYRQDIERDADVIEEVARLYGYGRIPTRTPVARLEACRRTRPLEAVKDALRKEGFNEAVNYSFMNEASLDLLEIPEGDPRRRAVRVMNPLRKEDSLLRTMLAASLLENFVHNFFRGVRDIRIFEVARVFRDDGGELPVESVRAGGVYCREKAPALWKEQAEDFYLVKGAVESLLDSLRVRGAAFVPCAEPFMHPARSADLEIGGRRAGYVGEVSPAVIEKLDVKARPRVLIFDLDMEAVLSAVPGETVYSTIPKYPPVDRDLSLLVDEGVRAAEIVDLIRSYPSEFVEEVAVFDFYKGPRIPAGKKSLAFSIRYRSSQGTLTDQEVEDLHRRIAGHVTLKTGAEVRGA
ncbi:MAG: phenylalanine--tRNA ligase subunit beta [Thermodesulfovibrionales bacterium]